MGLSSALGPVFRGVSFIVCPFDTKIITAGVGITHVDVGDAAILEQTVDLGLDDTIGNISLCKQPPAGGVCVEGERIGKHVCRDAPILGISLTFTLVDEYGTGQGKILLSMEGVVSEQNPPLVSDHERFQALPARAVTGGHLDMGRMAIAGRSQCFPDGTCDLISNGHYAIRLHCILADLVRCSCRMMPVLPKGRYPNLAVKFLVLLAYPWPSRHRRE
jgi:hypothetical protein